MKTVRAATILGLCCAAVLMTGQRTASADDGWDVYKADKYGFAMLIPHGTKIAEKEFGHGWAAMAAAHDGVEVIGIAKLGKAATPAEIEEFGVEATGIAASHWQEVDKGKGNGFKWFKTALAHDDHTAVVAVYGVGPKGNYLVLLKTTVKDFEAHKAGYMKWYHSITAY